MGSIVDGFGRFMENRVHRNPAGAGKWLLRSYQAYGWYQKHFPNQNLPVCRQYLANLSMQAIERPFSHPEKEVLVSLFLPSEIVQAMGLYPLCAEQFSTYINGAHAERPFVQASEQEGIAETFCSYHKVLEGAALTEVLPRPLAIVNCSLACDANSLTFRDIAERFGVPQYFVDVPYEKTQESVTYVAGQLREAVSLLEEAAGRKMDEEKLKAAVARSKRTMDTLRACIPYRKTRYLPTDLTSELYEGLQTHNALGTPGALEYAGRLLREYQAAPMGKGKKILWLHTNPFYQGCVKELLNYRESARIVYTELSWDNDVDMDPERPYEAMAQRLVYDSYNGPSEDRIKKALEKAREVEADGAVLFCHWGCKETCGASALFRRAFEAEGIPLLPLNGDGVDRLNTSDGQTKTRLEAFLEMLGEEK